MKINAMGWVNPEQLTSDWKMPNWKMPDDEDDEDDLMKSLRDMQ